MIQEVYAQAIEARLVVHELDASEGRPPRQFAPLPSYPALPVNQTESDEATHTSEQQGIKKEV